jgi:4-aminobutyrate aminotransferase-like enzyme
LGPQLDNLAAVIVEPVLSAGGMIFPPKDYLQRLFELTRRAGALFIVDEAQTGFGRCGRWFDIEHAEIEPDILVVSKTAGNGYPVAAVVVSDPVAARVEARGFSHLSSHQNDPLAAAAVHAVIDIVEEERLVDASRMMGDYFIGKLKELQARHPLISGVRGRGLMIALELSGESPHLRSSEIAFAMALLCEHKGLHLTFSYFEPVIRIIPPLILTRADIDLAIQIIDDTLGRLETSPPDLDELTPRNRRSGPYIRRLNRRLSPKRLLYRMWETSPQEWLKKLKAGL